MDDQIKDLIKLGMLYNAYKLAQLVHNKAMEQHVKTLILDRDGIMYGNHEGV